MEHALTPGLRLGDRYELSDRVGEGTFGDIWRATDTRLSGRPVAIKALKSEFLDRADVVARFESEADALSRLAHPNVVAVLDRGTQGSTRYIVTEYVEGRTLSSWLDDARRTGAPTGLVTVRALFDQVCAGVEAAHEVRVPGAIVHRDLKPDNVIVRSTQSGDALAKVLDFGIAQLGGRSGTNTGMLLGTPLYMAPEQAMGQVSGIGPWTDVFSLAVILVEMLTLRATPAGEETWWAVSLRSGGNVLPTLAALRGDVPAAVWFVLARALHADGGMRFGTAGQFRAALRGAWEQSSAGVARTMAMDMSGYAQPPMSTAPPQAAYGAAGGWAQPPQRFPAPHPIARAPSSSLFAPLIMGGLFASLLIAGGAWFFMMKGTRRPPEPLVQQQEYAPAPAPTPTPTYAPPVRPRVPRPTDDPDRVYAPVLRAGVPARGSNRAPVTMIIVSDFQCPFCARVLPTLDRLNEHYGTRLRNVWVNYPLSFHQRAMPAAEAAMEAQAQRGDVAFWQMHDLLFANQRSLAEADLERYATDIGLDLRRFRAALSDQRHQSAVRADMASINDAGVRAGTPVFLINGRLLRGAQPYERFVVAIDRALAESSH